MTPQKQQEILNHLEANNIEKELLHEMRTAIEDGSVEKYVRNEELDLFKKFFVLCDKTPEPLADMAIENEGKTEEQLIANSFNQTNRGTYYWNSSWARVNLRLVHFRHRKLFSTFRWELGKFSKDIYQHDTRLKNEDYIQQKITPFRLSPKEAK